MNNSLWIKTIAMTGAMCVALCSFAAHCLYSTLPAKAIAFSRTAVANPFLPTIALFSLVSLPEDLLVPRRQELVAKSWLLGIALFSGSLYTLVFTGISALGMITPLGGTAFICGWLVLFTGAKKRTD